MPNFKPSFGQGSLDLLINHMASTFVPIGNGQDGLLTAETSLQTPLLTHPHAHG